MKAITFVEQVTEGKKKGKMKFHGDFSWNAIRDFPVKDIPDLRFTLYKYEYESGTVLNNALLIDIDNTPIYGLPALLDACVKVMGKWKMHHVYSGKGHHVYVPLTDPFLNEARVYYKKSWEEKMTALEEEIKTEVDKGVFNGQVYGRIPGSINTKEGAGEVFYLETNDLPECPSINYALQNENRPAPKVRHREIEIIKKLNSQDILYRECGFLQYTHKNIDDVDYEVWKTAMVICSGARERSLAHKIGRDYKDYNPNEIEGFFSKQYIPKCSNIQTKLGDLEDNPCNSCKHNIGGSSPSFISGRLTTPSAVDTFHLMKNIGTRDDPMWVVNHDRIVPKDVANEWINRHERRSFSFKRALFVFEEKKWVKITDDMRRSKALSDTALKSLTVIPRHGIRSINDLKAVLEHLALSGEIREIDEMLLNDSRFIPFVNGVYNTETKTFGDNQLEYYQTECLGVDYSPTADCPNWLDFINHAIPAYSDRKLLQAFAGLALSNIESHHYQAFLWLYGATLTGKSLILRVLKALVGESKTVVLPGKMRGIDSSTGLPYDITGKSLLLMDDFKPDFKGRDKSTLEWLVTSMTGGAGVPVKKLYQDIFLVLPKTTFVVSSNDPPPYTHGQSGLLRRTRTIYFYNRFEEVNYSKEQAIMDELGGIVNWALEGLNDYLRNGLPEISKQEQYSLKMIQEDNKDMVSEFWDVWIDVTNVQQNRITFADLYDKFIKFSGLTEMTRGLFSRRVVDIAAIKMRMHPSAIRYRAAGHRGLEGVKFKEEEGKDE